MVSLSPSGETRAGTGVSLSVSVGDPAHAENETQAAGEVYEIVRVVGEKSLDVSLDGLNIASNGVALLAAGRMPTFPAYGIVSVL